MSETVTINTTPQGVIANDIEDLLNQESPSERANLNKQTNINQDEDINKESQQNPLNSQNISRREWTCFTARNCRNNT